MGQSSVKSIKHLPRLKVFREKFPFAENLRTIEWLDPDKLFKLNPDEVGEFFQLLEDIFKLLGYSSLNSSNVYRNARLQISDLKNLLRIAVDSRKSLAQKVDALWEKIGGLGQDKYLAKKIIFCFNYESGTVLPIFNNQHLRHFANRTVDSSSGQTKYFSMGQEYEHFTSELLKAKNSLASNARLDCPVLHTFLIQELSAARQRTHRFSREKNWKRSNRRAIRHARIHEVAWRLAKAR